MMLICYKFRAYPTAEQRNKIDLWLDICTELWNACLSEIEDERKVCLTLFTEKEIKERIRNLANTRYARLIGENKNKEVKSVYAQVLLDVLNRVRRGFETFWRGGGYPRKKNRRDSVTSFSYPCETSAIRLGAGYINLPKLGQVRLRLHRPIRGIMQTHPTRIVKENSRYYVVLTSEVPIVSLPETKQDAGIDLGVSAGNFAALSSGELISRPRWVKNQESRMRILQRKAARRFRKGQSQSNGWKKVIRQISDLNGQIARQRNDFQHKNSWAIVSANDLISMESGSIKSWQQSGLRGIRKSTGDAAPAAFREKIKYKAALYGRAYEEVDWDFTSQICPSCGVIEKKSLSQREHVCLCGYQGDRDVTAAKEIARRGRVQHALKQVNSQVIGERRDKRRPKQEPVRIAATETLSSTLSECCGDVEESEGCSQINKINDLQPNKSNISKGKLSSRQRLSQNASQIQENKRVETTAAALAGST